MEDFKYTEAERDATEKLLTRRELDRRTTSELDVILWWLEGTNVVVVSLCDTLGNDLEFAVDGSHALDAYRHPYAEAANQGVDYLTAGPLSARSDGF